MALEALRNLRTSVETLKGLKHTGIVHDYVKKFSPLMLDVHNMSKEER